MQTFKLPTEIQKNSTARTLTSGVHFNMAPHCVPLVRLGLEEVLWNAWLPVGRVRSRPQVIRILKIVTAPMSLVHVVNVRYDLSSFTMKFVVFMLWGPHTRPPHLPGAEPIQSRHLLATCQAASTAQARQLASPYPVKVRAELHSAHPTVDLGQSLEEACSPDGKQQTQRNVEYCFEYVVQNGNEPEFQRCFFHRHHHHTFRLHCAC